MNPLAVVITCFNKQPFLAEAVHSALRNDPSEIVIVDDGSLDGSLMEAHRLAALDARIRVISQRNLGAAAARNAGWRETTSPWLVFLDGDDRLCPHFATSTLCAAQRTGASIVGGHARMFGARSDVWQPQIWDPYYIRYDNSLPISSLVSRELVERVAGFNPSLPFAEDWDLWIRIGAFCPAVVQLQEVLYEYRRVASNTSGSSLSGFVDDNWELAAPMMMAANQSLYNVKDISFAVEQLLARGHEWSAPLVRHAERHPNSPLLQTLLGLVAEGRGEIARCAGLYAHAVSSGPANPLALWRLGGIALRTGKPSDAYNLFHQARVERPDFHFLVTADLDLISKAQQAHSR